MSGCFWRHDWEPWEQYVSEWTEYLTGIFYPKDMRGKSFACSALRQKRKCKRCGLMEDRPVREGDGR